MPSPASSVGGLDLPIDPGTSGAPITDPLLDGVLAYLTIWLNEDLTPKLANVNPGRVAVPAGNAHPWDPMTKPSMVFARGAGQGEAEPLPALYAWRGPTKRLKYTFLTGLRRVTVMVAYISDKITAPDEWSTFYGLQSAVEGSVQRAFEIGHHPRYLSDQSINVLLRLAGQGIYYDSSTPRMLAGVPTGDSSKNPKVRAYPTVICTLFAEEGVGIPSLTPDDTAPDLQVTLYATEDEDLLNAPPLLEHIVPAPPWEPDT